ncbi:acetyltransferase [Malaciobacter halophilus]|uniref:Acetyltransferase n=1 Tax=Malaciobacter halophilus TaxID=197482 RepID=A0A2N1J5N8_9BACT|nr:NeuD/PglB/VioB family sugar acetyltransferase [Malaciobacter halophilus]AXH09217.1 sugar O-acyltransferase [Malaciobacter halophilus]PKI81853.1 acetyltransferase [Malaciobacter halophilus]
MKELYIYGASGHGLVVADIARDNGYENIIFIDDGKNKYPTFEDIKKTNNIPIAFGIGSNAIRAKLFEKVHNSGFKIISLIHPSSIISSSATIGKGTVIMPNVVVNAKATIGEGAILNTSCVIEHECVIDDFVHISPNVALAGDVRVDKYTHIGIGSNVIQGIIIGKNVIVGGGSMVIRNIDDNQKVVGVPVRLISSTSNKKGGVNNSIYFPSVRRAS